MNISRNANLKARGERAAKTAHSMYCSCYNMIRTQILNCSQSGRNCKVGTAVQFQPSQKPTVLCPVRVTTCADKAGRVLGPVWHRTEPNSWPKHGPLAGSLDPSLTPHVPNNWNQTWMIRRTWKHGSHLQLSESQIYSDNIDWRWVVTVASTDSYNIIYGTAEFHLVHHFTGAPAVHHILGHTN